MKRCVLCTFVEAAHPEVGGGYLPHPFQAADQVRSESYTGPERRQRTRRMDDRVEAIEDAVAAVYDEPSEPERRHQERRAS